MAEPQIYFAYGSNMYTPRLRYRVPNVELIGGGELHGYRLRFHKRSKDLSGKCNAEHTGVSEDRVIGVLFKVPAAQLPDLHSAEGRGNGYADDIVTVRTADGKHYSALTYLASDGYIDDTLNPYDWYWEFVDSGARQHGLPEDYRTAFITNVAHHPDPDADRDHRERAKVRLA
jgi:hypothetical protein